MVQVYFDQTKTHNKETYLQGLIGKYKGLIASKKVSILYLHIINQVHKGFYLYFLLTQIFL